MIGLHRLIAIAACLALTACGTADNKGPFGPLVETLQANAEAPDTNPAMARASVSRQLIDTLPSSTAFFESVGTQAPAAGLVIHSVTSDPGRWSTLDNRVVLILHQGVPVRTHGLGYDLGNADVTPTLRALAEGATQTLTREMRSLDGAHQEIVRRFSCDFAPDGQEVISVFGRSHTTRRFIERCSDGEIDFENRYWRGGDGILWRSETWLSPRFGHLRIERLSVVSAAR